MPYTVSYLLIHLFKSLSLLVTELLFMHPAVVFIKGKDQQV